MVTWKLIAALAALVAVSLRPRSWASAAFVVACAAVELAGGLTGMAAAAGALRAVGPAMAFLAATMALALLAEGSGLAERLAARLAQLGRGRTAALFCWVCLACALLTAALSLDGAVVVMAPVLAALRRRGAPLRPLLLGTVAVANAFSAALPAGNPTNLVLMERLGLSPAGFVARMAAPSLVATLVCLAALALVERGALGERYPRQGPQGGRLSRGERGAAAALAAAALADWISPLAGFSPWLPVCAVAALSLSVARCRPRLALPLRVGAQVAGLLVVLEALRDSLSVTAVGAGTLPGLLAVAAGTAVLASLANNLPASAAVAALVAPGAAPYAALLGLSAGALATPHGSVATIASLELAGEQPPPWLRRWAPAALAAVAAATGLLWLLL